MAAIKYLTVHCAATPEGRDNSAAQIKAWDHERFAKTVPGFIASYHHVIELDGTIVRHLRDDQKGVHVANHNSGNIGICYVGGTESLNAGGKPKDTRTPAQKLSLAKIIRDYQAWYPGIIIRGHRDWPGVAKACPSFDVTSWIKAGMPS